MRIKFLMPGETQGPRHEDYDEWVAGLGLDEEDPEVGMPDSIVDNPPPATVITPEVADQLNAANAAAPEKYGHAGDVNQILQTAEKEGKIKPPLKASDSD